MKKNKNWLLILALIGLYLASRLYKLVFLPVFADEAIYIRWAQLIIDDWQQYFFFPFNDGKTPLQMWLIVPLQFIFKDQLFAGRFLSVIMGLFQMWAMALISQALGGKKLSQVLASLSVIILPFFFFHHRMALTDALLTLMLSFSFYFAVQANQKKAILNSIFAGIFLGLAFWSKIPAILFIPSLLLIPFIKKQKFEFKNVFKQITYPSLSILIGLTIFIIFKLHPAFGQLFNRGNDFLYPLSEFFKQPFQIVWTNFLGFSDSLTSYLTWPLFTIICFSFIKIKKLRQTNFILVLASLSFLLPMLLLGKTVYARYLMPSIITLVTSFSLSFEKLWQKCTRPGKTIVLILGLVSLISSLRFMFFSFYSLNNIPFTKQDKIQYIYEWSAGFGVKETVVYLNLLKESNNVLVASEGYFGTLPDGLLMYYHRQDVSNLFIQGIGQPVRDLPEEFISKADNYDQIVLVVNSHRMKMPTEEITLLVEYCRPNNVCHQIWDITNYTKSLKNS